MSGKHDLSSFEPDDVEIPKPPMISKPPMVMPERRESDLPQVVSSGTDRVRRLAEQRFKPTIIKRQTSIRLEPWLDEALQRRVSEMHDAGYRRMTREAVITDALIQYLGVKPPKD